MKTPTTPASSAIPPVSIITPDTTMKATTPLAIDASFDEYAIKSIPIEDTWKVYVFNCDVLSFDENEWNALSDNDKYDNLLKLRNTPINNIASKSTAFVITPDTDDAVIRKIPKKDCKILLKQYAHDQGYPHFGTTIGGMLS